MCTLLCSVFIDQPGKSHSKMCLILILNLCLSARLLVLEEKCRKLRRVSRKTTWTCASDHSVKLNSGYFSAVRWTEIRSGILMGSNINSRLLWIWSVSEQLMTGCHLDCGLPPFPSETFRYKISGGDYFSSPSCEVTLMVLLQILSYSSPWRWPRPETGYEQESSGQDGKHGSQYSAGCLAAQPQTSKEERAPPPPPWYFYQLNWLLLELVVKEIGAVLIGVMFNMDVSIGRLQKAKNMASTGFNKEWPACSKFTESNESLKGNLLKPPQCFQEK